MAARLHISDRLLHDFTSVRFTVGYNQRWERTLNAWVWFSSGSCQVSENRVRFCSGSVTTRVQFGSVLNDSFLALQNCIHHRRKRLFCFVK